MPSTIFENAIQQVTPERTAFIKMSVEITKRIQELMKARGLSQNDLAKALDKSPSEISKWLSGMHNFTLRSIAKLETVLDAPIIVKAKDKELDAVALMDKLVLLKKQVAAIEETLIEVRAI